MKFRFDSVVHWVWTLIFSMLMLSGLAMVGAKNGWLLNFDIALADRYHRVFAAIYVLAALVSIVYEIYHSLKTPYKKLTWFIFGKSGYQLFTFLTTLIFIITGAIIWVCMDSNMHATAIALYIHEKLTYFVLASVIWHIYQKCHALLIPNFKKANDHAK